MLTLLHLLLLVEEVPDQLAGGRRELAALMQLSFLALLCLFLIVSATVGFGGLGDEVFGQFIKLVLLLLLAGDLEQVD